MCTAVDLLVRAEIFDVRDLRSIYMLHLHWLRSRARNLGNEFEVNGANTMRRPSRDVLSPNLKTYSITRSREGLGTEARCN